MESDYSSERGFNRASNSRRNVNWTESIGGKERQGKKIKCICSSIRVCVEIRKVPRRLPRGKPSA